MKHKKFAKINFYSLLTTFGAVFIFNHSSIQAADAFVPKYGPAGEPYASLLRNDQTYIHAHNAPDFWSLMPYYEGMRGDHSASAASVATALNALREGMRYSASDELVTEDSLLKKVTAENWAAAITGDKPKGVELEQLSTIVKSALESYAITDREVQVISVSDSQAKSVKNIREILIKNERSNKDVIIAHYMQSAFTGDPEGAVGTYSTVGAFDAHSNRVLILETDRKYYEPYWVSLKTFVEGLSTLKSKAEPKKNLGGLLLIQSKK